MEPIWIPNRDSTTSGIVKQIWTTWASDATSTASTTWADWNGWPSTTATTTNDSLYAHYVWRQWNAPLVNVHTPPRSEPAITARLLAEDRERRAAQREDDRLRNEQRAKAEEVARALLDSMLTPEQREMRDRLKRFRVVAQDGEVYEIETHRQIHNVFRMRGEQRIEELCLYHGGVPLSDNALAQKLMLETNVEEFRRIANKWDLMDGRKLVAGA